MENVNDLTMYHIHRSNEYDNLWRENGFIDIDDDFISYMTYNFKSFGTGLKTSKGVLDFNNLLALIKNPEDLRKEDKNTLVSLLKEARIIISNASLINRERALEEFRSKYYPNLPSRYHSIWLADSNSFDYWRNVLNRNNSSFFKLSVTGDLFRSNDLLLPQSFLTYEELYDNAERYWNPDLDSVPRERDEYLFRGKARIIKKLW